jgi:chromatin remodeling complex protein RSC6
MEPLLADQFEKCNATIALFKIQLNQLSLIFKQIEKQTVKELKRTKEGKKNEKKEKIKIKRDVKSGMVEPRPLSDALCVFLNVPLHTSMSRPDVTKQLNQYIKEHGLYSKEHRCLIPDESFKTLVGDPDFKLTHFTMQRCMNKHYIALV